MFWVRNLYRILIKSQFHECLFEDYAATTYKPDAMIDSATLTGAMMIALGDGCTGVFCKDNNLWDLIEKSGYETGDRAWRMPHYKHYFG